MPEFTVVFVDSATFNQLLVLFWSGSGWTDNVASNCTGSKL